MVTRFAGYILVVFIVISSYIVSGDENEEVNNWIKEMIDFSSDEKLNGENRIVRARAEDDVSKNNNYRKEKEHTLAQKTFDTSHGEVVMTMSQMPNKQYAITLKMVSDPNEWPRMLKLMRAFAERS